MPKIDATADTLLRECDPGVRAIYTRLIDALARVGSFEQDARKTSIHLVHGTAFAACIRARRGSC